GITTAVEQGDAGALGALRLMEREAEHDPELRDALIQTEFQDEIAQWRTREAVPLDRLITQYTTGDSTAGQIISSIQEKRAQLDEMQRAAERKGATHAEIAELQIEYEKKLMQF